MSSGPVRKAACMFMRFKFMVQAVIRGLQHQLPYVQGAANFFNVWLCLRLGRAWENDRDGND